MPRPEVIHLRNGLLSACSIVGEHKTTDHELVTCRRCLAIIAKRQKKAAP
jgi:hypothetical protein